MDLTVLERIKNLNGEPLFSFQKEDVLKMLSRKHNLLAHEPGLGKSAMAIALWETLGLRKILVVTKASLKSGFKKHIENWQLNKRLIQIIQGKTDFISDLSEIVIVNYDIISHNYIYQQLTQTKWDLLICDESHALKNMSAKRTKTILSTNGLVRYATRTLMMTGTPVLNRPIELYPMLKVLAPTVIAPYSDYYRYGRRYCAGYMDGFGFNTDGASHMDELNKNLREKYMIRRLTHEVQVQLPTKRFEVVFIDSNEGVRTKLRTLDQAGRTDFQHQTLNTDAGGLATLRRETAEAKVEAAIDVIREYVESCSKIVIFAYHHTVIKRLQIEFKSSVTIDGSTTQKGREMAISMFRNNESTSVFIGQIDAAGEGIDGLQNCCSNALFVEFSWVPGSIEQAIKRIHRIGQTKPCLFRFLVWADSIEEHQMRVALDKVKTIKEILK